VNLVFSSRVSKQHRPALEELLFFNPGQSRVRSGIINSLEKFGHPRLEESVENLSVRVGEREAQTLFAYDRGLRDSAPVGLVIFLRTSQEEIAIIHVAVHADYALQGNYGGLGLGTILVEKVKEIALRIVGVRRIVFFYRQEVVIRLQT
jgi:ribosomal protein S18 acetylase RimI-like enzyme